ncbi:MAG: hypothetical protein KC468_35925, partial [Myxococcales bacterium]|nr:hypothetical protein [Myxococcales bacterium]
VDKNGAAVELARGCVWLETGAREGGVAALVQGLRAGDSLVGVSWSQARRFDWREERDEENRSQETGGVIEEALEEARREIEAGVEGRWREVAGVISDALVGAYFSSERAGAREGARRRARGEVERWLEGGAKQPLEGALGELRGRGRALGAFHWELEYGEELLLGTGFDAVVGNPPFAGKNGVSAVGGRGLRDWLKTVHAGAHGNADLSAHFLRRASWALRGEGALGLITTNTIGQGDTRATGLVPVLGEGGGVVYRATRSREWPGAAAVSVSVVHVGFGEAARAAGTAVLDGEAVGKINSRLRAGRERGEPARLGANAGLSYQGCIVLGKGFVLTEEERERLLAADARNEERIEPLIGGEEVNRSP